MTIANSAVESSTQVAHETVERATFPLRRTGKRSQISHDDQHMAYANESARDDHMHCSSCKETRFNGIRDNHTRTGCQAELGAFADIAFLVGKLK
eukprot:3146264-Amphidinium_carterae.1